MLSFKDIFIYYTTQEFNPKIVKALLLPVTLAISLKSTETEYHHQNLFCVQTSSCLLTQHSRKYRNINSYYLK